MTLYFRPQHHRVAYLSGRAPAGRLVAGPEISIGPDDDSDFAAVRLTLDPLPGETFDDRDVERLLTASEARELAAALNHYAAELDR